MAPPALPSLPSAPVITLPPTYTQAPPVRMPPGTQIVDVTVPLEPAPPSPQQMLVFSPPPPAPVPVERAREKVELPVKVQRVVERPVVVTEVVDRPVYVDRVVEQPVYRAPRQAPPPPRPAERWTGSVEIRTVQVKSWVPPDFPYHDPTPDRGCDFWGEWAPEPHD